MNEEQIEDRHMVMAARRAHESRKDTAELIVRKAEELAKMMTELGRLGVRVEVEFSETAGGWHDRGAEFIIYSPRVHITEPPVVLASTSKFPR